MPGFVRLALYSTVMILPALAGCATHTATAQTAPRCKAVGCIEPLDLATAGPGSTVLLVQCVDATQTQRRYQLEAGGWTLQMYETVAVATCPASAAR
nr:hypothetical protein [uncultured Pseudoxanthomonas sp.]